MSELLTDRRIIDGLIKFYAGDLEASVKSGLVDADFGQMGRSGLLQWLNLFLYKPQVGLVWSGDLSSSQLEAFTPYLARTKLRYAIFAKSSKGASSAATIPAFTSAPDFAPAAAIASAPSLQTLLYATDRLENFNYVRKNPQCIHAFVGHGESDKHIGHSRLAQGYDFVFAASSASVERIRRAGVDIDVSRFLLKGGWPVMGVEAEDRPGPFKKVLYAPTWEGLGADRNYCSAAGVEKLLGAFVASGGELRFRPHQDLGSKKPAVKEACEGLQRLADAGSAEKSQDFNWSDVLIADVSGVINEYLFSKKPVIVPIGAKGDWLRTYIESSPLSSYCYLWPYLDISLADYLQTIVDDPMRASRMAWRDQFYHGARTTDDLCDLFERAVTYCATTQQQYSLRSPEQTQKDQEAAKLFAASPADPDKAAVVQRIRAGELMLSDKE